MQRALLTILISLIALPVLAAQVKLAPYKDKLFAYPPVIDQDAAIDYISVAYDKQRDIYGRDKIPLRKAKRIYVTENLGWSRKVRKYKSPNGTFKYFTIGRSKGGAEVTVIYLYGQGGNRFQGVNDWTFGGNFNRLQVLMKNHKGVLVTPDYTDFEDRGTADITSLLLEFRRRSPNTVLIVACGSMGGGVCWRLAENPKTAAEIDGMFLLGSHWNFDFLKTPMANGKARPIPLYIGHGSWDPVFKPEKQLRFYRALRKQAPSYPSRFVMFDTGKHGTPIRMVDWRREINWMLSLHK